MNHKHQVLGISLFPQHFINHWLLKEFKTFLASWVTYTHCYFCFQLPAATWAASLVITSTPVEVPLGNRIDLGLDELCFARLDETIASAERTSLQLPLGAY